ncbi:MAG: patatin-like phospholipase family protein, partial [Candidatus Binatia bacterium]
PRTEETYVGWIKRFIFFHNKRHPGEMGEPEIGQFLSSLATDRHVSASTQNQALNALLFLYHEVLHEPARILFLSFSTPADSLPTSLPLYNTHSKELKSAQRFSPTRFIPNAAQGIPSKLSSSQASGIKCYTMPYHFRNLVFEGGGIKGIAHVGAMEVLKDKGILPNIRRVGGTSAGAINATLFALGFSTAEQNNIMKNLDFNNFVDDSWGVVRDTERLINRFGWYKGDFFHEWISAHINKKLGDPNVTFENLKEARRPDLYVYGTNLSTRFGEVFSHEHTPSARISDAVRISMSIPLFFAAFRNARNDVYVDGGVLNNYPVKLFDREKYIDPESRNKMAVKTDYYEKENKRFLKKRPNSSPYRYNKETLGFRLDSKQEIGLFRYGSEPKHNEIDDFFDYIKALVTTIIESQGNRHLHGDDWQRTVYIDTLGVGTTEFDLTEAMKKRLRESGRKCTEAYFRWFDSPQAKPANRP